MDIEFHLREAKVIVELDGIPSDEKMNVYGIRSHCGFLMGLTV